MNRYDIVTQEGRHCHHCASADMIMRRTNQFYRVCPMFRETLVEFAKEHGVTTIPIIFANGVLIGGYIDLVSHLKEEGLLPNDYED